MNLSLDVDFFFVVVAGLLRQPKWGHLRDLHKAIKLCEDALIATDPKITSLGSNLEVTNNNKTSMSLHFLQHSLIESFYII